VAGRTGRWSRYTVRDIE